MELKNSFDVPASPEDVWAFLLKVEEVVPCMPGAELTEVVDEDNWRGAVKVKLGPVSLSYSGKVTVQERNPGQRRLVMRAKGTEARGKGTASAVVTSQVSGANGTSRVEVTTELVISGAAAQFGRGLLADVSQKFADDFAAALARRLTTPSPSAEAAAPTLAAKPISGLRLALWAFWRSLGRGLKRLFGGSQAPADRR